MLTQSGLRKNYRKNYVVLAIVLLCSVLIAVERMVSVALLRSLVGTLWAWVLVLAAIALLLGVVNVLVVHCRRVVAGSRSWANSLILVAVIVAVIVMGSLGASGSRSPFAEWVFAAVLVPGMGTLFAMLAFFMVAAGYRYLRVSAPSAARAAQNRPGDRGARAHGGGGWMLAGALLFLCLQMPMLNAVLPPAATGFAGWVLDVPAMATWRGVLLGGSLALMVTGTRLMLQGK